MEEEIRRIVIKQYRNVITERFPNYQVKVFGSCCNGLYLPNSDIDLVIINGEEENIPGQRMSSVLSKLTRKLHPHTNYIYLVKKAKIPIIKLVDARSKLNVDISYNTAENTTKVAVFVTEKLLEYPDIKWMVLFLKLYLANRDLNNNANGGLGGFAVFLLVLSFLELYPMLYKDTKLDFYTKSNSKAKILLDFFHFYGRILDINSVGLAPTGMEGDRSVIMVDKEYYYNEIEPEKVKLAYSGYARPKMLLLDPTNQTNNTAKGCSLIDTIFAEFNKSYNRLLTIAANNSLQFDGGAYIGFLCNEIVEISQDEVGKRVEFKKLGLRMGLSLWDGNLHLQNSFWSDSKGNKHAFASTSNASPSNKRPIDTNHYHGGNKIHKPNNIQKNPNVNKQSPPKQLSNQKQHPNNKSSPKPNPHQKKVPSNQKQSPQKNANSTHQKKPNPNHAHPKQKPSHKPNTPIQSNQQKGNPSANSKPNHTSKKGAFNSQIFALKNPANQPNVPNKQFQKKRKGNSSKKQGGSFQNAQSNTPKLHQIRSSPNKIVKNKN
ncbi:Non-canonical poly(A) RNA polymerase papd5 [Terramyces sp. JEL0728]|nr:Non-canonical poly(A) RNA polymerase papd5 [Terramyces sp. JEL0728]